MQEEREGEGMRRGFKRSVKGKERAWEDRRGSMMDEMDEEEAEWRMSSTKDLEDDDEDGETKARGEGAERSTAFLLYAALSSISAPLLRRLNSHISSSDASLSSTSPAYTHLSLLSVRSLSSSNDDALTRRAPSIGMTGNIVDLVICIASVIGSLTIIIAYAVNKRQRKLRHALILGLATSDLATS